VIREHAQPDQRIFIGVIDPIDPRVDAPEEVRDRILEAAEYIPSDRLGKGALPAALCAARCAGCAGATESARAYLPPRG